jgi:hypothetical protein
MYSDHSIADDIKENIGYQGKFDAAIIVIKITDFRASIYDVIAWKAIKEFFYHLTPEHIFCCFTYCDVNIPSPNVI